MRSPTAAPTTPSVGPGGSEGGYVEGASAEQIGYQRARARFGFSMLADRVAGGRASGRRVNIDWADRPSPQRFPTRPNIVHVDADLDDAGQVLPNRNPVLVVTDGEPRAGEGPQV